MAQTHGTGRWRREDIGSLGAECVIEEGVLIWNAAQVHLAEGVYVGHRAMLKGDTRGELRIGAGSWIGQDVYLQSAGGIEIGAKVGVGPRAMVLTSTHAETPPPAAVLDAPLEFAPVAIGEGCDIGLGAILLPGTTLGPGVQVGAGAVVSGEFPGGTVLAGVPARVLRERGTGR